MEKNSNTVKAINRNVRSGARKINILLKNIRGKKVDVAIKNLSFARQRIASEIKKTVQSAVANAENNNQFDIDNLYIKEAYVGESTDAYRRMPNHLQNPIRKDLNKVHLISSKSFKIWISRLFL